MKRKLFIGSSTEGLTFATMVLSQVNELHENWLEPQIWSDGGVFTLNKSALDSLIKVARKFDYGILIACKDDIIKSRRKKIHIPRDNVMFEMGMFLGSLGLTRAFLLVEKESKLPTDYNGVTVSYFQRDKAGSLEKAIKMILKSISQTKTTFNLKPVPSAALALGYFDNFILPLAKRKHKEGIDFKVKIILPKNIADIHAERISYNKNHPSKEMSIYGDNTRPIIFELQHQPNSYWDFPSTLSTLSKLMDLILPSQEIGIDKEKHDWIEHELRSFVGTIEMLVSQNESCKGRINFERLV